MKSLFSLIFCTCVFTILSACEQEQSAAVVSIGDGNSVFWIAPEDTALIQYRSLDAVNLLRAQQRLTPLTLSAELIAAAQTHADDMARQQRPWHFGAKGSSPAERVARTGYNGTLLGENIAETFEDDFFTLLAWVEDRSARRALLHPEARFIGLAWFQEPETGKIWWVQLIGTGASNTPASVAP